MTKKLDRIHGALIALGLTLIVFCCARLWVIGQLQIVIRHSEPGGSAEWMAKFLGPAREEWTIKEWIKSGEYEEIPIPPGSTKVLRVPTPNVGIVYCYVFVDQTGIIIGRFWYDT